MLQVWYTLSCSWGLVPAYENAVGGGVWREGGWEEGRVEYDGARTLQVGSACMECGRVMEMGTARRGGSDVEQVVICIIGPSSNLLA